MNDDQRQLGSEVLTQGEVERLLSEVKAEELKVNVVRSSGRRAAFKPEDIQPYDFRQPAFLAPTELRKIRLRHEDFIRSMAAHLSIHLRLEFGLRMSKLQTLSYQRMVESLPNPTYVSLFKAEPLRGICLLSLPPQLGLTIVDRLLGGPAHSVNGNRDLSEIESALLDQVVRIILTEWCNQWQKSMDLRPVLLGHESNARFLHTAAHDTVMLALFMEASLGDCVEQLHLAFPYYTVEPLVRQLNQTTTADRESVAGIPHAPRWNAEFNDIEVKLSAGWPGLRLSARQLTQLRVGDVLGVDPQLMQETQVAVAGVPKFVGRLGTHRQRWAIELTRRLET